MSTDGTPAILGELAGALDHIEVTRLSHSAESHRLIEPFAGTATWILAVDGDELYDPERLSSGHSSRPGCSTTSSGSDRPASLRRARRVAWDCSWLPVATGAAAARPTELRCDPLLAERPLAAAPRRRRRVSRRLLVEELASSRNGAGWEASPFRDLTCASSGVRASTARTPRRAGRTSARRRVSVGAGSPDERLARRLRSGPRSEGDRSEWKAEKYRRGERVIVDVSSFFGEVR